MIMKQSTVLTVVPGCTGILWMGGANACFCFSEGSGARSQPAPVNFHSAPPFYLPPVTLTSPGTVPATAYSGYPSSGVPNPQYPLVPEQAQQQ